MGFSRSSVYALHGMVACSQPLVSEIGISIMKRGGNAIDAAIAMASVLGVVEPCSTSVGGEYISYTLKCKDSAVLWTEWKR